MTIKIGNYYVEYSNYDINDDIKSGEAIISTGSSLNLGGLLWPNLFSFCIVYPFVVLVCN